MTSLPFLREIHPTKPVEVSAKAVKPAGGRTQLEDRLLNALRRQRFKSPGALAKFVKQDDTEVRDTLNRLVGRGLVHWQDDSFDAAGAGYRAADFQPPEKSRKSDLRDRLGFR